MWLLMLAREWEELEIETNMGHHVRITGYAMPMEGGGRMPTSGFMPLFKTFEHAEAARGECSDAPIYEITPVVPGEMTFEDQDFFEEGPEDANSD